MRACASILFACVAAVTAGCNILTPAMWVAQGPPKEPAVYADLPKDKKTTVYVDDRKSVVSRTQLRAALADDIAEQLRKEGVLNNVVSGRELIAFVRKNETSNKRLTMEELGTAVGAEVLIYVEMVDFKLSADGASPQPTATARIKVLDIKSRERLFPPPGGEHAGYEVTAQTEALQPGIYRTSAGRRQVEEMMEKRLADAIAKCFYDHEKRSFGGGVSGLGGG